MRIESAPLRAPLRLRAAVLRRQADTPSRLARQRLGRALLRARAAGRADVAGG